MVMFVGVRFSFPQGLFFVDLTHFQALKESYSNSQCFVAMSGVRCEKG